MAIENNICLSCDHSLVCKKIDTLSKFDNDSKKFIDMDIKINSCKDYVNSDEGNEDSD